MDTVNLLCGEKDHPKIGRRADSWLDFWNCFATQTNDVKINLQRCKELDTFFLFWLRLWTRGNRPGQWIKNWLMARYASHLSFYGVFTSWFARSTTAKNCRCQSLKSFIPKASKNTVATFSQFVKSQFRKCWLTFRKTWQPAGSFWGWAEFVRGVRFEE